MKDRAICIALVALLCGCAGESRAATGVSAPATASPAVQRAQAAETASQAAPPLVVVTSTPAPSPMPTGTALPTLTVAPAATSTPVPTSTPLPAATPTPARPEFAVTRLSDVTFHAHATGFQPNEPVTAHLERSDGAPCVWQGQPCIWQRQADAAGVYDRESDFSGVGTRGTFRYWLECASSGTSNSMTIQLIDPNVPDTSLPLDEQAEEHVVARTLVLLNSSQGTKGAMRANLASPISYLETNTVQLGQVAGRNLRPADIVQGGISEESNYVHFRWYSESFDTFTNIGNVWRLVSGEAELRDLRAVVTKSTTLSPADRANGLLWQGEVKVSYIVRYRARVKMGPDYTRPSAPTQAYSPWTDDYTTGTAELRNGTWERVGAVSGVLTPIRPMTIGKLGALYASDCPAMRTGCDIPAGVSPGSGSSSVVQPAVRTGVLGKLDFVAWCQHLYGASATVANADGTAYGVKCRDGASLIGIWTPDACKWQYHDPNADSRYTNMSDPGSWECFDASANR